MNVSVETGDLNAAIAFLKTKAKESVGFPICSHILLSAEEHSLALRTTDLEVYLQMSIPALNKAPGAIAVPASVLEAQLKAANGSVSIVANSSAARRVSVSSGNAKSSIVCMNASGFPEMPQPEGGAQTFTVEPKDLAFLLRSTEYAIGDRESSGRKGSVEGVLLKHLPGKISAMATNGAQLAVVTVPSAQETDAQVVLPAKFLPTLKRIAESAEEPVEITVSKNMVFAKSRDTIIASRMLDVYFPDLTRVLPDVTQRPKILVKTADLKGAMEAAKPFTANPLVKQMREIALQFGDGIKITAFEQNSGEFEASVAAEGENQPDLKVSFNFDYINDFLGSHSEEYTAIFPGPNATTHVEFRPGAGDSEAYRYVSAAIMPKGGA